MQTLDLEFYWHFDLSQIHFVSFTSWLGLVMELFPAGSLLGH